ncbi:MAG: NAD-dependent deacylase [Verrucomicrobiota bacterium JB025]|nr:NAD-dependent deacylase [Verrucomicrobiota bacterium JB025]
MRKQKRAIVILTGAGISAESGLATFRDQDGLWEGHAVDEVATPEAFERNPELVQRFYNLRRAALATVEPNAAHRALARLQDEYGGRVTLITQNVDDLHERGGFSGAIHMHGELRRVKCEVCHWEGGWEGDLEVTTACPECGTTGHLRPDIVWFGEMPYSMDVIEAAVGSAGVFAAIGTSGLVYPAAGLVRLAKFAGAETVEINNKETAVSGTFDRCRTGPASVEVPAWVDELLAED